jgi:hypothetical protein
VGPVSDPSRGCPRCVIGYTDQSRRRRAWSSTDSDNGTSIPGTQHARLSLVRSVTPIAYPPFAPLGYGFAWTFAGFVLLTAPADDEPSLLSTG